MVLPAGQLSSLDFGSYEEMKKQRWTCIDILKCLAALAVSVCSAGFLYDHWFLLLRNSGTQAGA